MCKRLQAQSCGHVQVAQTSPTAQRSSFHQVSSRLLLPRHQPLCLPGVGGMRGEEGGHSGVKLGRKRKVNDGLDQLPDKAHPLAMQVPGQRVAGREDSSFCWQHYLMVGLSDAEVMGDMRGRDKGSNDLDPYIVSLCEPHG